jgi:hypothetical protein
VPSGHAAARKSATESVDPAALRASSASADFACKNGNGWWILRAISQTVDCALFAKKTHAIYALVAIKIPRAIPNQNHQMRVVNRREDCAGV